MDAHDVKPHLLLQQEGNSKLKIWKLADALAERVHVA